MDQVVQTWWQFVTDNTADTAVENWEADTSSPETLADLAMDRVRQADEFGRYIVEYSEDPQSFPPSLLDLERSLADNRRAMAEDDDGFTLADAREFAGYCKQIIGHIVEWVEPQLAGTSHQRP